MRTGEIKCGYGIWAPWISRDLTDGKIHGVVVEIMEAVAKRLDLKTDWSYESGWGTLPEDLRSGKVDMVCPAIWNDPKRGKSMAMTDPIFYIPVYAYMREDDQRSFQSLSDINNEDIRISLMDGSYTDNLAGRFFPKAKRLAIPQTAQETETFLNIATGKADIVFADSIVIQEFNNNNKVKLKRALAEPVTIYGNSYAVDIHEAELKEMLQTVVKSLIQTGEIEDLTRDFLKQYPDALILPAKPYQIPE